MGLQKRGYGDDHRLGARGRAASDDSRGPETLYVLQHRTQQREQQMSQRITPNLWFDTEAQDAAAFYTSIFPNSTIGRVVHYNDAGPRPAGMVATVEFELDGQRVVALNGGPQFKFSEAISLIVSCDSQEQIDYYWDHLADGGEEGPCGWLKDRFGVSWQIVPAGMERLFGDPDPERARRTWAAMLQMRKLDISALEAAADGVAVS
jgi:predicted 3-demethylubiquinone-9 3-methyltransferase (glyoxalase superfamily)